MGNVEMIAKALDDLFRQVRGVLGVNFTIEVYEVLRAFKGYYDELLKELSNRRFYEFSEIFNISRMNGDWGKVPESYAYPRAR